MPRKGEYQDLTGKKFNRLTVIRYSCTTTNRRTMWVCRCDCGKELIVYSGHLKNGHTKSCGCFNKERIGELNKKTGMTRTKLYYTYRNILNRCYRENVSSHKYYGDRNILVCPEWLDKENGFENFMKWALSNGYQEGLSIDRIDNYKGYSPDNCRWVDNYVQANNKRHNYYLKINGEIDTIGNLSRKYNVSYWNLLHYAKGGRNNKYPDLKIEVCDGI